MSNPLETIKSFIGLEDDNSGIDRKDSMSSETSIEPTSDIVEANSAKTELKPSAPAILPTRLPAASEMNQADDEIAIVGDAEAGVSLNEIMPTRTEPKGLASIDGWEIRK